MKLLKNALILVLIVALFVLLGVLGYGIYNYYFKQTPNPVVTFELENYGTVKMELYPEYAPNTVANIIKLVESGYYNDKVFYGKDGICLYIGRNSEGEAVIPTASLVDPNVEKDSENDIQYQIKGEFVANGFEGNTLSHEKGVVSLIRYDYTQQIGSLYEESYNSGNSQIGIMINDARDLNGLYTAFGRVIEGMDIIDSIVAGTKIVEVTEEEATSGIEEFETKPVMKNVTVDTFGVDYGIPTYEDYFDFQAYLTDMLSQYYSTETIAN